MVWLRDRGRRRAALGIGWLFLRTDRRWRGVGCGSTMARGPVFSGNRPGQHLAFSGRAYPVVPGAYPCGPEGLPPGSRRPTRCVPNATLGGPAMAHAGPAAGRLLLAEAGPPFPEPTLDTYRMPPDKTIGRPRCSRSPARGQESGPCPTFPQHPARPRTRLGTRARSDP
jgi:hypothetical protein